MAAGTASGQQSGFFPVGSQRHQEAQEKLASLRANTTRATDELEAIVRAGAMGTGHPLHSLPPSLVEARSRASKRSFAEAIKAAKSLYRMLPKERRGIEQHPPPPHQLPAGDAPPHNARNDREAVQQFA